MDELKQIIFQEDYEKLLLSLTKDTDITTLNDNCGVNDGMNLFHFACMCSNINIVKCLVERGINYNLRTRRGLTPLFLAVKSIRLETVKYLLTLDNIDLYCVNNNGNSVISYVWERANKGYYLLGYHMEVKELLQEYIAKQTKEVLDEYLCDDLISLITEKVFM